MYKENCPICEEAMVKIELFGLSSREIYREFICQNCGAVCITDKALGRLSKNKREKKQVAQLLNEKYTRDLSSSPKDEDIPTQERLEEYLKSKFLLIIENDDDRRQELNYPVQTIDQFLKTYPQNISEKLNRSLCNIARMQSYFLTYPFTPNEYCMFAKSVNEAKYYSQMLIDSGFCADSTVGTVGNLMPHLSLTLAGWQRFEKLERDWQNSTTAFIAMWFNEATEKYRDAVKEAILKAGYEPKVIDDHEHNNFIMDEVINQINEAKFVIADFTCIPEQPEKSSKIPGGVRGGVYFEAGYAKGLGKEVIVTCKDDADSKKRRHFDIDQLNTLFWKEQNGKLVDSNGKDFVHRLAERIKATVGKGKLIS